MHNLPYRRFSVRIAALTAVAGLAMLPIPAAAIQGQSAGTSAQVDRAALQSAADSDAVRALYAARDWQPMWTDATRQALNSALAGRDRHGLDHVEFALDASGVDPAAREVAFTKAALRYAAMLARGGVDPTSLHDVYTIPRPDPDLNAGLAKAVSNGSLADWLQSLAPQDDEYRQLSEAYRRYNGAAADGAAVSEPIPAGDLIEVGDTDPRLPAILKRLRDGGYSSDDSGGSGGSDTSSYGERASAAVSRLQRDFGIADDGVIGPDTLTALNMGPSDRARAIAVALERRRWLVRSPAATRIDVNVAAARLRYFRDNQVVDSRNVVVGKPGNETPALQSPMYRLVANPTWTVPKSIQNGELANVGQSYFDSHNMVIRDGWIVQQPGPDNALGLVKFDMQNQHAIYLHDTSSPELFGRSQRELSHGCVRVEDATGFAAMLAEQAGITDKWEEARQSGDQTFVPLPENIPVRLLYQNVFVDDAGALAFRTDPYGWDDAVAQQLGFAPPDHAREQREQAPDIGP